MWYLNPEFKDSVKSFVDPDSFKKLIIACIIFGAIFIVIEENERKRKGERGFFD